MKKVQPRRIAIAIQMALLSLSATAQMAPVNSPSVATKSDVPSKLEAPSEKLEAVVVTAQKRKELVQDVPVSVTVVTPREIESRGISDAISLQQAATSLRVGDQNVYSIRGVGTLSAGGNAFIEGSVATSIDGVNMVRASMGNMTFADINGIEVLNGPQGMLFGKNADAGLINITTARPVLDVLSGSLHQEFSQRTTGVTGQGNLTQGVLNAPVSENSALRINVFNTDQSSLVNQVGPAVGSELGQRQSGVKLKYLWQPTDKLELYFIGDHVERTGAAESPYERTVRSSNASGPLPWGVPGQLANLAAIGITPSTSNVTMGADSPSQFNFTTDGVQAEATYDLGDGYSLVNLLSHRSYSESQRQDGDATAVDIFSNLTSNASYSQTSNELRLVSPKGRDLEGQMGLYYLTSHLNQHAVSVGQLGFPGPVVPGTQYNVGQDNIDDLNSTSTAIFGQGSYRATEKLKLLAGARYTQDRNDITLTQDGSRFGMLVLTPTLSTTQQNNANNFSYKLGTQYDFDRDTMGYVTYATGYKGPGFNNTTSVAGISSLGVAPETVGAFEIGLKQSFFENRMNLNISLFDQNFKDLQVQTFSPTTTSFITQNSATAHAQGLEMQVVGKPSSKLRLSAGVTLLSAKFGDFAGAQCYVGQAACASNGTFNAAGVSLPNAPAQTATLQAEYKTTLADTVRVTYEANLYYRSDVNFSANGDPGMQLPSATTLGASVSFETFDGKWRASLFCRNCTDERVPTSLSPDAVQANFGNRAYLQQWGYSSFLTLGASVDYRF